MEGKTIKKIGTEKKSFLDVFDGGKYKNFTTIEETEITPKEIFKDKKVPKKSQFYFRVSPMKWWDKQASVDARAKYMQSNSFLLAVEASGVAMQDLFPDAKDGDTIDMKNVDIEAMLRVVPHMGNGKTSAEYYEIVYSMVKKYTDVVILSAGNEQPFSEVIDVIAQDVQYMSFIFNSLIDISTPTAEEENAVK